MDQGLSTSASASPAPGAAAGPVPALSISNIEVVYHHTVQALRGLSIEVPHGKVVALLGSNGAGKTTTLKAASGILALENGRVASGSVRFFGEDIARWAPHVLPRRGMAHVREGRHVFAELTVDENLIAAGNALKGRGGKPLDIEAVFDYFPRLKERRNTKAGSLSGGEQQMLTMCRSLLGNPLVILIDEPTEGLAPKIVTQVGECIQDMHRQGVAVVLVEQKLAIALKVSTRVCVMGHGHIVFEGSPEALQGDRELLAQWLAV